MPFPTTLLAVSAVAAVVAAPALARDHHRGRNHVGAERAGARFAYGDDGRGNFAYPQAYGGYYGTSGWEAANNARLTAQAYREPGLTLELAPDSKQTATGGPSGGVPGFSGH